jgi:hypothetical protein
MSARSSKFSLLFPVGERHQLVQDFLQPLKTTFVVSRCTCRPPLAAMNVQTVRFANLCYFLSQLGDAFFDGILHGDKASRRSERITVERHASPPTNGVVMRDGSDRQLPAGAMPATPR